MKKNLKILLIINFLLTVKSIYTSEQSKKELIDFVKLEKEINQDIEDIKRINLIVNNALTFLPDSINQII